MPDTILILDRLTVGYGRQPVLQNLNAAIARGDSVGFLGANGSGKTTLLKTIAGVLPPMVGRVRFTSDTSDAKRPVIGYVPQRESLDQSYFLSSFEVALMAVCGRIGPGKFIGRAERHWTRECLQRTGSADLAERRFAELSGGQKQRVLIARALVAKSELLLLDEPTAGVDTAATAAIADLLASLHADGMTLVMVNHDLPVLRRVARRIFWLKEGALEAGTVEEMLRAQRQERMSIE